MTRKKQGKKCPSRLELSADVEARRSGMLKEVETERKWRLKAVESDLLLTQTNLNGELTRLQEEIKAKKEEARHLGEVVSAKRLDLAELDRALSNRQRLLDELAKQALEIACGQQ